MMLLATYITGCLALAFSMSFRDEKISNKVYYYVTTTYSALFLLSVFVLEATGNGFLFMMLITSACFYVIAVTSYAESSK